MLRWCLLASFLVSVSGEALASGELIVRHKRPQTSQDARNEYFVQVLDLALRKTAGTDGPYRLEALPVAVEEGLSGKGLELGVGVDVDWLMTSREREKKLLPVRIPLLKGLSGYRVFLIRKDDQKRFDAVQKVEDLRAFKAGQAKAWVDSQILKANGLPVVEVPGYESLFFLLASGRFDYFPRNVSEVLPESAAHSDKGLSVEKKLLLYYPTAEYFFVNRKNKALADRLERGLRAAIRDGSFDQLFRSFPPHKVVLEKVGQHGRTILTLKNPLLPKETPLREAGLWLLPPPEGKSGP